MEVSRAVGTCVRTCELLAVLRARKRRLGVCRPTSAEKREEKRKSEAISVGERGMMARRAATDAGQHPESWARRRPTRAAPLAVTRHSARAKERLAHRRPHKKKGGGATPRGWEGRVKVRRAATDVGATPRGWALRTPHPHPATRWAITAPRARGRLRVYIWKTHLQL